MNVLLGRFLLLCAAAAMFGCHTIPDRQWVYVCQPEQTCDDRALDRAIQPPKDPMYVDGNGWGAHRIKSTEAPPKGVERTEFLKAYLEFNQQGQAFDPLQLKAIRRYLDPAIGLAPAGPLLIMVYVHGWHHNADISKTDEAENVVKFDYLLARGVDSLRRTGHGNYHVLGVYVGWQGEQTRVPIASLFSIGERAAVADTIGKPQAPDGAREGRLRDSLQKIADDMRARKDGSRMIVIGHSLGGRMLSQAFLSDLEQGSHQPLGSGTIINPINAAIGAEAYRALFDHESYETVPLGPPTWVNITTKSDHATGLVYPLALAFHLLRPVSYGEDSKHTIGHYLPYVTHTFDVKDCLVNDEDGPKGCNPPANMDLLASKRPWNSLGTPFALRYTDRQAALKNNHSYRDYCGLFWPRAGNIDPYQTARKAGICLGLINDVRGNADDSLDRVIAPLNGRIWNIRTSNRVIDFAESRFFEFSTHNGYVQTNWTRLLVELVMDDGIDVEKDGR